MKQRTLPDSRRARVRARARRRGVRLGAIGTAFAVITAGIVIAALPQAAQATKRIDASVVGGNGRLTTAWRPVAGARGYDVTVSSSPAMTNAFVRHATRPPLALSGLKNDRTYFVRVSARGRARVASDLRWATTSADRPHRLARSAVRPAGRYRYRVSWHGTGPVTAVAVLAEAIGPGFRSRFASGWRPATTRGLTLTVPSAVRRALSTASGTRVVLRVLQSNRVSETAAPQALGAAEPLQLVSAPVPLTAATAPSPEPTASTGSARTAPQAPSAPGSVAPTPAPPTAPATTEPSGAPSAEPTEEPTPTTAPTTSSAPSEMPSPTPTSSNAPSPAPSTAAPTPTDPDPTAPPTSSKPPKAFPHLTATDFGAVGDGRADDQSALEAAVRAARSAGKPLYLPPGTYAHSRQLELNGVLLYGSSTKSTRLKGTRQGDHAILLTGTRPGVVNVTVTGTGKGPRTSIRSGNGVYVNYATHYLIRNVHISDVTGAGVMVENSAGGVERNNLVERTGADGMYHTEGTHDVDIAYNRTIRTGDDGISVTSYGKDTHDIVIHHNSVMDNWESRAITVNGTSGGIVIRDNHIDGGTSGISCTSHTGWSYAQTRGVQAYGNTIRNINQSRHDTGTIGGGAISFWNDSTGDDSGTSIHDNQIYRPGLFGIYVGGGSPISASVKNNRVYSDGTLFRSDNGRSNIDRSGTSAKSTGSYPGDLVPSSVGGLDSDYRYTP